MDAYLASTPLLLDGHWHKGESSETHPASSGVYKVLGDGRELADYEQCRRAVEYIEAHRDDLRTLGNYPGVTTFNLGVQRRVELDDNITGFCTGPSRMLMWHALDVGLGLTFYVTLDRQETPWPQVLRPEDIRDLYEDFFGHDDAPTRRSQQMAALRLDQDVLAWFRRQGRGVPDADERRAAGLHEGAHNVDVISTGGVSFRRAKLGNFWRGWGSEGMISAPARPDGVRRGWAGEQGVLREFDDVSANDGPGCGGCGGVGVVFVRGGRW